MTRRAADGGGDTCMADGTNRQDFVFIANEENDFFSIPRTDKHYTQGVRFSLLWPDDEVP